MRTAGLERNPVASSRTDLGVHARMQVLSMRVVGGMEVADVAPRLNALLPPTLGIACVREAVPKFNATWNATGKEYRYRVATHSSFAPPWAWAVDVDAPALRELVERLPGTRDFSAFHDSSSAPRPRTIRSARLVELSDGIFDLRLVGDGFARYMVRFLVGAMVDVVRGSLPRDVFDAALERAVPFTKRRAPAEALILWNVEYPPDLDPFPSDLRQLAPGLPAEPPFVLLSREDALRTSPADR